jgi:hypothetical protein
MPQDCGGGGALDDDDEVEAGGSGLVLQPQASHVHVAGEEDDMLLRSCLCRWAGGGWRLRLLFRSLQAKRSV